MNASPHRADGRGQSSPIGIVLLLGLIIAGATSIAVFGGTVLQDSQDRSEVGQAEQAMTQFDARAAQVALGDSDSQTVQLGGSSGTYSVREDVGRVRLLHGDWNGSTCADCEADYGGFDNTSSDGNTTVLYNETLGAIVYESGDTELAYQGGGVWRKSARGGARAVSTPEFHYRDATLTFPLVRVQGSGSTSGDTTARVTRVETASDIYANPPETYPDGETKLLNPVENGNMSVEITSEYCEGWRSYFIERTDGDVSECNDGTVTADIVALGTQGEFRATKGEQIEVRGMNDGHALSSFEFEFRLPEDQASDFNNIQWRMYGEDSEGRQLEFYITASGIGSNDCPGDFPEPVRAVVYYSPDDGANYQSWVNDGSHGVGDYEIECQGGDAVLNVDFLDSDIEFEYTDYKGLSGNKKPHFDGEAENFETSTSFGAHAPEDFEDGSITYPDDDPDENATLITNHYFAEQGATTMKIDEANNAGFSGKTTGTIEYEGSGEVVTYLHVTENRVEVELS